LATHGASKLKFSARRWQTYAGKAAILAASGEGFETIEE
jgi:hypothetical protein